MRLDHPVLRCVACVLSASCHGTGLPVDDTGPVGDTGEGTCPSATLSTDTLSFSGVALGEPATGEVVVTNDCVGEGELSVTPSVVGDADFSVASATVSAEPGQGIAIDVEFTTADYEIHDGTLLLATNSPSGTLAVSLAGQAAADQDGDGHDAVAAGGDDCDDADPTVNPSATETWNGVDDDCSGRIDDALVERVASGWLDGAPGGFLGFSGSLATGDLDDDGDEELVLASTACTTGGLGGEVYIVERAGAVTAQDEAMDVASAWVDDASVHPCFGQVGRRMADNDGDGVADLVVAGADEHDEGPSGDISWALFSGPVSGPLYASHATVVATGVKSRDFSNVLSHVDLDGDGIADVAYAPRRTTDSRPGLYIYRHLDAWSGTGSSPVPDLVLRGEEPEDGSDLNAALNGGLAGGDLDRDGYGDLVACASATDAGACYLITGLSDLTGSAQASAVATATIEGVEGTRSVDHAYRSAVGDLDGDRASDLALATAGSDQGVAIFLSAGDLVGHISALEADHLVQTEYGSPGAVELGDADDDGRDDLALVQYDYTSGTHRSQEVDLLAASTILATDTVDAGDAPCLTTDVSVTKFEGVLLTDLDDDDRADVVVSHPGFDTTDNVGRIWFVTQP